MSFMEKQITSKQDWVKVETSAGVEFLPVAELGLYVRSTNGAYQLSESELAKYHNMLAPYCEGIPEEWETISGYGARMSAPGYMDCTEWVVFDTVEEAESYLAENYGDDEEDAQ